MAGVTLLERPARMLDGLPPLARPHLLALMYHRLGDGDGWYQSETTIFEQQLCLLAERGYQGVTMEQVIAFGAGEADLPTRAALISFDDNYLSMMRELALPAVLRVAERTGVRFPLVWAVVTGTRDWTLFSPESFCWMRRWEWEGWLDVQSHTVSHPALPTLVDQPEKLFFELHESRQALDASISGPIGPDACGDTARMEAVDRVEKRVSTLVLPYGAGQDDLAVLSAAREAGYRCVLAATPVCPHKKVMLRYDSLFPVGRIGMGGQDGGLRTVADLAYLLDRIERQYSFDFEERLLARKLFETDR